MAILTAWNLVRGRVLEAGGRVGAGTWHLEQSLTGTIYHRSLRLASRLA